MLPARRLLSSAATRAERPWVRRTGAVLFSGVVVGTGYLSWWQLTRYKWKLDVVAKRSEMLKAVAEPLASVLPPETAPHGMPDELEFRRVVCLGTFDHSKQVLMGPRSAPAGMEAASAAAGGGRAPAGAPHASGWDVITPLTCSDGSSLLVNRGWVPRDQTASLSQPSGIQRVEGVLRKGEAGNRFATNDPERGRFVYLDVDALAERAGTSRVVVYETNGGGGGEGGSQWPAHRPLSSFLDFYVQPSTHLVRPRTGGRRRLRGGFCGRTRPQLLCAPQRTLRVPSPPHPSPPPPLLC